MTIRNSTEKDFAEIMQIYSHARKFMAENGNPNQWGINNWPPENLIHQDILQKKSFVCVENEKIVGTFFYNFGENIEPTYIKIFDGEWKNFSAYGVIHRMASSGEVKGVGKFCLNWAFEKSKHLRIDTHADNKIMQKLLENLDFEKCGIIYVEQDNFPRYAYEKFS